MTDVSLVMAKEHRFTFGEVEYPFRQISPSMLGDLNVWVKSRKLRTVLEAIPADGTAERMAERMHVIKSFSLAVEINLEEEISDIGALLRILYLSALTCNADLVEDEFMLSLGKATKEELDNVVEVLTALVTGRDGEEIVDEAKKPIPTVGNQP